MLTKNFKVGIVFFFLLFTTSILVNAQDLNIYRLFTHEVHTGEEITFISLSETYHTSDHKDSTALPPLGTKYKKELHYLKLDGEYRERFFTGTKTLKTDSIFIYDYANDVLASIPVSKASVVACLSPYLWEDDWPFEEYYYMIGFQLDTNLLQGIKKYYSNTLVYVGAKNPFVRNQMKPMIWKKIEQDKFPSNVKGFDISAVIAQDGYKKFDYADVFLYETKEYRYFIRNIEVEEINYMLADNVYGRQLAVMKIDSDEIVCERFFYTDEGSSLSPLKISNSDENNWDYQWAGNLFKDMAPVVFGFEFLSFSCEGITFLNKSKSDLYIKCDSRH